MATRIESIQEMVREANRELGPAEMEDLQAKWAKEREIKEAKLQANWIKTKARREAKEKAMYGKELVMFKNSTIMPDDLLKQAIVVASKITGIDATKIPFLFTSRTIRETCLCGTAKYDYTEDHEHYADNSRTTTRTMKSVSTMGWTPETDYDITFSMKVTIQKIWSRKDRKGWSCLPDHPDYSISRATDLCQAIAAALDWGTGRELKDRADYKYDEDLVLAIAEVYENHKLSYYK